MRPTDESPHSDPRIGKTLGGKWHLDRLLGIGGMASVYAASHRNGATAAIKILHPEFGRRAEARMRFLREAYIANKAGKGAVAVLDDDVDDEGLPYLVMELLHGETVDVREEREGGRLPLTEVLWIASQTLAVLEVAHSNGIIHRDLKPENLFWTEDARLKVLDFGIARMRDTQQSETTRAGMVMGTPSFMAPEQALGNIAEIDGRTDIWSVGAIMFRLLTGEDVHGEGGNTVVAAATRRARSIATVDPTLPGEVVRIIDRALQFERTDRYPNAYEMRADIDALLDLPDEPTLIPPAASALAGVAESEAATLVPGFATQMSDTDALALRDMFERIAEALLSIGERGSSHEESRRLFDEAFDLAQSSLSVAHIGLFWNVTPHGFMARRSELIWQPRPPLPASPARMYADGVRMLGILPGLKRDEFELLVRMSAGEMSPHHDFATLLRETPLENLVYRLDAKRGSDLEESSVGPTGSNRSLSSAILGSLATTDDPELRVGLLERLARGGAEGREAAIGELLQRSAVDLAIGLLRLLDKLGSDAARDALRKATDHRHPVIRIEALSILDPDGEKVHLELRRALEEAPAGARVATLVDAERHKVQAVAPPLIERLKSPSFSALPREERRQTMATLAAVSPERAEALAIELLLDARIRSEAHDVTRELAAELLGRIATSREAAEALSAASKSHWEASESARAAAARALSMFTARGAARTNNPTPGVITGTSVTMKAVAPPRRRSSRPPGHAPHGKKSDRPPKR